MHSGSLGLLTQDSFSPLPDDLRLKNDNTLGSQHITRPANISGDGKLCLELI